jgi:hypothetical protein
MLIGESNAVVLYFKAPNVGQASISFDLGAPEHPNQDFPVWLAFRVNCFDGVDDDLHDGGVDRRVRTNVFYCSANVYVAHIPNCSGKS